MSQDKREQKEGTYKTSTSVAFPFPLLTNSSVSENRNMISSISSSSLMAVSIKDNLLPETEGLGLFRGDGPLSAVDSDVLLARKALETEIAH